MQDVEQDKQGYQKLKAREFIDISIWSFKFVYKLNPRNTIVYTISTLVTGLFSVANSYIMAKLVDILVSSIKTQEVNPYNARLFVSVIFGFSVFRMLINYIARSARLNLQFINQPKVTREFYKKINSLGIQTLEQPKVNDLIHRADMYTGNLVPYFFQSLDLLTVFVRLFSLIAVVSVFSPLYVGISIILAIPLFIQDKSQRTNIYKFQFENTENRRKASNSANNLTDTNKLKEINLTQAFGFLENKYWNFQSWYAEIRINIMMKWRKQSFWLNIFLQGINVIFIYNIILDAFRGLITTGTMLFRYQTIDQLQGVLTQTLASINDLSEQALQLSDVYNLFKLKSDFPEGHIKIKKLKEGPEITFDNVTFSYPNTDKKVIENLNLHIKSGEKIAIVGANGAGKTTLVKLICKIYSLNNGKININKNTLADLNTNDWHKNIGILFQDFNTYPQLTVKENIYIGDAETKLDETAIRLAAEQAEASGFINEFPQKYDQILGEKFKGGIRPSTGQWQKIAIARFFYRNSPLVIFDEPTASIDAVSEYSIFNTIYKFFKNKTVIIISHRFSTVRNADRILVLEGGKIIEQGNHEELMKLNGKYAESFLLQAKGYVDSIA